MSDYLQPADLANDKKHSTFFSEVITGKDGGLAGGANIDTATNAVTSQTQKTMPKIMGDAELSFDAQLNAQHVEHASQISAHEIEHDNQIAAHESEFISQLQAQGWNPVVGSFETGGTIVNRRDILWWEVAKAWYSWQGTIPLGGYVVVAGSTPATAGGVASDAWVDRTDGALRSELTKGAIFVRNNLYSLRDFVSVKDFGAIGDGMSHPLSGIFSTLADAQLVYPIATSLTQEIDFIAGQTANNYCHSKGGGSVYWPAGHYLGTGYDGITLRSNVSNFGDGYSSFLDFNWNAVKTEGVWGGAVTSADWKNISSINGRFITLTSPSDAAIFSAYVGKLVMLRSAEMDSTIHSKFYETVKVKSVNTSTGVVELYDAIIDAIVSPQLAISSYDLVQNVELFRLRLRSSQLTVNIPLYIDGIYKSHIHHLWFEGSNGLAWNGITKSSIHDIFCTVYAASTNLSNLAIEVKYGSYNSSFERIFVDIINTDNTTELMNMISVGERSRDIRINGVTINASDCNAELYGQNKTVRSIVKNVVARLNNASRVLTVRQSTGGGSINSNSVFSDFEVYVNGVFGAGVIFDGGGTTESDIHAKNIHIYGTSGIYAGQNYGSIYLGNNTYGCSVENSNIQGKYLDAGVGNYIHECLTSGPTDSTTRSKLSAVRCITKYGNTAPPSPALAVGVYLGTVANTVITSIPTTPNFPYVLGDSFSIKAKGFVGGTGGIKTILLTSTDGDFFSSIIPAGTAGAWSLDAQAIIITIGGGNIGVRMEGTLTVNGVVTSFDYLRNMSSSVVKTFYLEAWKANAADVMASYMAEMKFIGIE